MREKDRISAAWSGSFVAPEIKPLPFPVTPAPDGKMKLVLHLGAHKTATSYLQGRLNSNKRQLAKASVLYLPHRQLRQNLTFPAHLNALRGEADHESRKISDDVFGRVTQDYFCEMLSTKPARLILSDENSLGLCVQCVWQGQLYPLASENLASIARGLPAKPDVILLAIRNFADFFASVYAEFLLGRAPKGRKRILGIKKFKRRILEREHRWGEIVSDICTIFPDSPLRIWRYEDFKPLEPVLWQEFLGDTDPAVMKKPGPERPRQRPSRAAMRAYLDQLQADPETAPEVRDHIIAQYNDPTYMRFDPWTHDERQKLQAMYDKDVAEIKRRGLATLL